MVVGGLGLFRLPRNQPTDESSRQPPVLMTRTYTRSFILLDLMLTITAKASYS